MKRGTVYLAGLISTEFLASLEWRKLVTPVLREQGFDVLDPLRGKEDLSYASMDGGLNHKDLTPSDIVLRDYNDVKNSDIILMNLNTFGSTRPLLGTIAELAWAWYLRIPVVAVASSDDKLMRNHPFVKEFVAHYCVDLFGEEGALEFINCHYGRF